MGSPDVFIIGGCGHVGLPLGLAFANAGLQVALYDADAERTATVRAGRMPFLEYGAEPILGDTLGRTLKVVDAIDGAAEAEYVVVTVGTPVDEYMNPVTGPIFELASDLSGRLRPGQNLVLRSTVYPGTTAELHRHLRSLDLDVRLTYCPERIAQGYAIEELDRLPQLVAGFDDESVEAAVRLFRHITERVLVVEVEEAELAKLFLNAWRYIQFGIANQFYMMAEERGLDFFRIYEAMTAGYDRAGDFPRPGFTAGPCLLKDTMQLAAFERNRFQLGHAAMLVNEGLANFIATRLRESQDLSTKVVGILGMAFKANIDDTRDSLAFKLRKILRFHGARVLASDPFVADESFVTTEELVAESDIIVIGAPHDAYASLDIPSEKHVVDPWGFLPRERVAVGVQ